MNKIRIYGIIVLLFAFSNIFATIDPPANPDDSDPGHPEYNVVNTGNDMITYEFQGNTYKMKITVADGYDPHIISKKEDGSGVGLVLTGIIDNSLCLNSDIIDPDVVLVNEHGTQNIYALIVYETINGDINLVIKNFDDNWQIPGQAWLHVNSMNLGKGHHPNIDISTAVDKKLFPWISDKFVITWENKGDIKSFAGEFQNGLFNYGQIGTVFNGSKDTRKPDVTISYIKYNYQPSPNPSISPTADHYWVTSYTFLNENELIVVQDTLFSDVFTGSFNNSYKRIRYSFNSTDILGSPRIASPDNDHGLAPYDSCDYTIVIGAVIDPSGSSVHHSILGFNKHFGVTPSPYHYEYNNTTGIYEDNPVVAYAGDIIIVAWEIDAWSGNSFGLSGRDIIQHQLTYNGSFATNYYSRVNMDVAETQAIPSVAADYSYDVLYSFYDENDLNIRFKSSHCINQNLRIGKQHDIIGIYPNPTTDILNVNTKEDASIQLFDINGRIVYQNFFAAGNHKLDVSSYAKGVYILRLNRISEVQTQRIVIY